MNDVAATVTNRNLPARHEAFAQAYASCFNRAEAARRAGYSEKRAKVTGCDLYADPAVRARIDELLAEMAEDTRLQKHLFIEELCTLALSSIAHYEAVPLLEAMAATGRPDPLGIRVKADAPVDAMRAVKRVTQQSYENANGRYVTETKIELHEKGPAITTGLKILGVLTDKLEVKADSGFADLLRAARERVANGKQG